MTTPSDILGPLGDAILDGSEDNMPEYTVTEIAFLSQSGRIIDPEQEWTSTNPTTMVITTATGQKFRLSIEPYSRAP